MILRLATLMATATLALATPALAQFSSSDGAVPAQNSVCDPNHSSYDAEHCAANPLGATSQAVVHIERARPDLPQGEVTSADAPLQPGQDPVAGGNEP